MVWVGRRLRLLGFSILLALISLQSSAQTLSCDKIYRSANQLTTHADAFPDLIPFGEAKPHGKGAGQFDHNTRYSNELPEVVDVKDQCSLGVCHLYSWLSFLEYTQYKQSGSMIHLSSQYLIIGHWMQKSFAALESHSKDVDFSLGSQSYESFSAISSLGLIPDQAWVGRRDFNLSRYAKHLSEYVQNIIFRAKFELQKIKPKNENGIENFMKGFDKTKIADKTQTAEPKFDVESEEKRRAIITKARQEIKQLFASLLGPMPTEFVYEGVSYTPQDFMKHYFPHLSGDVYKIEPTFFRKGHQHEVIDYSNRKNKKFEVRLDKLEDIATAVLDQGIPVYLSYQHNFNFVDRKTGVMSISAFQFPQIGRPVPRAIRGKFNYEKNLHAVQIVGYDRDPRTGRVLKWKIKNSWGADVGDHGYYHMYSDYFRAYVNVISFAGADVSAMDLPFATRP